MKEKEGATHARVPNDTRNGRLFSISYTQLQL